MSEVSSETCDSRLTANVTNINFLFLAYQVQYRLAGRNFLENLQVYCRRTFVQLLAFCGAFRKFGLFFDIVFPRRCHWVIVSWFSKALPLG